MKKSKITIYTDSIYDEDTGEFITDTKEIAKIIKSHISHLGKFSVYYKDQKKRSKWQNILLRSIRK